MLRKSSFLFLLALFVPTAHADLYWYKQLKNPHAHHGGHGRGMKQYYLNDISADLPISVKLIHSDLKTVELSLEQDLAKFKTTGKGNYHALIALQQSEKLERSAIRYLYFNGRPVDHSPSEIVQVKKATLQITPAPLPREHWKYESRKTYHFILSLNGEPLANHPLLATTAYGLNQILHSDDKGYVELTVPEDFPEIIPESRATPEGDLRLFTSTEIAGKRYETSISAPYRVSPRNWKSASLGFLFIGIGGVTGLLLIRKLPAHQRRKKA